MIFDESLKQLVRLYAADELAKRRANAMNTKRTAFVQITDAILDDGIGGGGQLVLAEPGILSNDLVKNEVVGNSKRRNSFGKNRDQNGNMNNDVSVISSNHEMASMANSNTKENGKKKQKKNPPPPQLARELDENDYNQYLYGFRDIDGDYEQNQYQNVYASPIYQYGKGLNINGNMADNGNNNDGVNALQSSLIVFGVMGLIGILLLLCIICVCLVAFGGYYYGINQRSNPSSLSYHRIVIKSDDETVNDDIV